MGEIYREETDPSAILDKEERDSIWDGPDQRGVV